MKKAQMNRISNAEYRILSNKIQNSKFRSGFTLVEVLVATTILVVLASGIVITLNPQAQINKALDSQKQEELKAIRSELDIYYHDTNCYPRDGQLPFGNEWKSTDGKTVYMKKVPQDPKCNNGVGTCYQYVTDTSVEGSSCPQWNVVFAKLSKAPLESACPLASLSSCTPQGYDSSWGCVISGSAKCPSLLSYQLITPTPGQQPTQEVVPTLPVAVPTLPQDVVGSVAGAQSFTIAQPEGSNPVFRQGSIAPLLGKVGTVQSFSVVADDSIADISSVSVTIKTDTKTVTYPLTRTDGVANNGTWSKNWTLTDTTNTFFTITLNGEDSSGKKSSVTVTIK